MDVGHRAFQGHLGTQTQVERGVGRRNHRCDRGSIGRSRGRAGEEGQECIRKCLMGLSAEHREIVDLVYYHEKSVEEVAEIVGIPMNTVKTRMFYARKRLAELLKAGGIERGWP